MAAAPAATSADFQSQQAPSVRFDLIDEPWVPVLRGGGRTLVSLRDALVGAGDFAALAPEMATQIPAVLRQVLLPVVLDALGAPHSRVEWSVWFASGAFSPDQRQVLSDYLDEHHDHFDLFDGARPFSQVAGLHTERGETRSAALLLPAIAAGNNVPLFSSVTEAEEVSLTPAEAAVWLLHCQCWDTAAIKTGAVGDSTVQAGKTAGNPTGPLGRLGVVVPVGRTLFETLMLNIPIVRGAHQRLGCPQWREEHSPQWTERSARSLLDLLTWQARRIRLFPQMRPAGVRVSRVLVAAGDRLTQTPEYEPHTVWRAEKAVKAGRPPLVPARHQAGRAAWRGLASLLALERAHDAEDQCTSELLRQVGELQVEECLPLDYPLRVQTCGLIYGNKSAVVDDAILDEIPVPVAALVNRDGLRDVVLELARTADDLALAVNNLSADLRRATGANPIPWDKGQRPGELVIHALDPWVRRLLAGLQRAGADPDLIERGREAWEVVAYDEVRKVATMVLDTAPLQTFAGRTTDDGRSYREATARYFFDRRINELLPRAANNRHNQAR